MGWSDSVGGLSDASAAIVIVMMEIEYRKRRMEQCRADGCRSSADLDSGTRLGDGQSEVVTRV